MGTASARHGNGTAKRGKGDGDRQRAACETGQPARGPGMGTGNTRHAHRARQLALGKPDQDWPARDKGTALASSDLGNSRSQLATRDRNWLARAWGTALASARS